MWVTWQTLILGMLNGMGLRLLPLVTLDLGDVDRARGVVLVRYGKGGKDRLVPLGAEALHRTPRYLETRRP